MTSKESVIKKSLPKFQMILLTISRKKRLTVSSKSYRLCSILEI